MADTLSPRRAASTSPGHYRWIRSPDEAPLGELPSALLLLLERPRHVPSPSAFRPPESPYVRAAVDAEARAVLDAPEGERNDRLNRAAFSLGQLVGGGVLTRADAHAALLDAAGRSGYIADDGARAAGKTIDSGLDRGVDSPRRPSDDRPPSRPMAVSLGGLARAELPVEHVDLPELIYFSAAAPSPTDWLIGGLLPTQSCVLIGAEEKTGKTWLVFEIALCLAAGRAVIGRWSARRRGITLLISPEGSRGGMMRRLHGLCHGKGIDPHDIGRSLPIWPGRLSLANADHVACLHKTIAAIRPDLLVIDPLVTATDGAEENDAGAMQAHLNTIRGLQQSHADLTIIVTHHLSKGNKERSAWHALRGSSAVGAWADGLITLRRTSESAVAPRRIDVWHRDDPSPPPGGFVLQFDHDNGPAAGVPSVRLAQREVD